MGEDHWLLHHRLLAEGVNMATGGDMLKLKSSQGEIFEVEPEVACMSTLIKNMVDDSGTDEEIPLPNVKTAILSKVIDYCKYHKDNAPEEIQKPLKRKYFLSSFWRLITLISKAFLTLRALKSRP